MKITNMFLSLATLMMLLSISPKCIAQDSPVSASKTSLTVQEAFTLVENGAVLIDVREPEEIEEIAFQVNNAMHIPLGTLGDNLSSIPQDRQVILACKSGRRSLQAYDFLKDKGYVNIANMEGGMLAWEEAGLPVTKNAQMNTKSQIKPCCANPNSKDCNPDGTCKKSKKAKGKACCSGDKKSHKKSEACCSNKKSS